MKRPGFFRAALFGLVLAVAASGWLAPARAEESLGDKLRKVFAPTPTPTPHKRRKTTTQKKSSAEKSPTPKPTAESDETPASSPHRKKKTSSSDSDASPSPKKKKLHASPAPEESPTPDETPRPKKKSTSRPSESPEPKTSASPKKKKTHASPSPSPAASPTPEETPSESEAPTPTASPSATEKKKGAPATIASSQISGFENYPGAVQKIIELSLNLAGQNLDYKYGSDDPATGGMDCSGFIHYILTQNGAHDVPRDASGQYVWVRKSGKFQAVVSRSDDTFELNEMKPGDLLFWTGTYSVERDPPITHVMIYLGREKGSNRRVMVGASDGRTYKGESRYGVSVFDFKIPRAASGKNEGRVPTFVGYGPVPGL